MHPGPTNQPHLSLPMARVQSAWPASLFLHPLSFPSHTMNPPVKGVAWLEGRPKGARGTVTGPGARERVAPASLNRPWCRWTGSSSVCFWRRMKTSTCSGSPTTSPWVGTYARHTQPSPLSPQPPPPPLGGFSVSSAFQPETPSHTLTRTGKQGLACCGAAH